MNEMIGHDDVVAWLRTFAAVVAERRDELTELDAAIGDADHGVNMDRGMQAVASKLAQLGASKPAQAVAKSDGPGDGPEGDGQGGRPEDVGALFKTVGMTLVSTVGGAAGPLYGTLFLRMASEAGSRTELTLADWAAALRAGVLGVQARGKAELGDKTMLDALLPAAEALSAAAASDASLADALRRCADAAEGGMKATIPLVARKGRASYLGERSAGHQDPGATSSWLLLAVAADSLASPGRSERADTPAAGRANTATAPDRRTGADAPTTDRRAGTDAPTSPEPA